MPGTRLSPEIIVAGRGGPSNPYWVNWYAARGYHLDVRGDWAAQRDASGRIYQDQYGNLAVWQISGAQGSGVFADIKDNAQVIALIAAIFGAPYLLGDPAVAAAPEASPVQLSGPGSDAAVPASSQGAAAAAGAGAADASAAASSASDAAAAPIEDAAGSGAQVAADTTSSITDSIKSTIADIKGTLGDVLGPIGDTLHSITGLVQDINEGIIKPIVGPITAAIDTFKALRQVIETDLKAGIKGILRIPGDLANGLGSLDATVQRSLTMLGVQNASALHDILVPALLGKDGRTLGDLNATFSSVLAAPSGGIKHPPQFKLTEEGGLEKYIEWANAQQTELEAATSIPALLFQWLFKLTGVLEGLIAQREPFVELWRESIQKQFPVTRLDIGATQELYKRGELDEVDAMDELRVKGLSDERSAALLTLARALPQTSQVLNWYARGWVDNVQASAMLRLQGWEDKDHDLLLNSSYTELDAGTLLELYRRGELREEDVQVTLQRQGFRPFDAKLILQSSNRLLGLQDLIQLFDRASVQTHGAGFDTLQQPAPDQLKREGLKLGINPGDVDILWANHWRLLSPELAVQAYFRGFINLPMLHEALSAASLPEELHQNFIDLQRPQVPVRSITTLIAQGIINESDGLQLLQQRGFTLVDANTMVSIEKRAAAPSAAHELDATHGLTTSVVLQLFDAGTITKDEAGATLTHLGWGADAISSTLTLHEVKAAAAERSSSIELIIDRAKAGLLTYDEATAELGGLSLTATEANKALRALTSQTSAHTKLPGEAKLLAMWKHGLLDEAATLDALTLLGYSPSWAQLLIDLEAAGGNRQQGQDSTG